MNIKSWSRVHGIFLTVFLICSFSCNDSRIDQLEAKIAELELELEECQIDEEELVNRIQEALNNDNYEEAKKLITTLSIKYPSNNNLSSFNVKLLESQKLFAILQKVKQDSILEVERLSNSNTTGIWKINYFVDEFNEPTEQGFITTSEKIAGYFSNTATQNSPLLVNIIIEAKNKFAFQLFEYAGNNPVKAYSTDEYVVLVQGKNGIRERLSAKNWSDRLVFGPSHSTKLNNLIKEGGLIKFSLYESRTPTSQYYFEILDSSYLENAFRLIEENKS